MDLLKKILILVHHLLLVHANNLSITDLDNTQITSCNGVDPLTALSCKLVIGKHIQLLSTTADNYGNRVCGALKNDYWCYPPYSCTRTGLFLWPKGPFSLPPYPPWLIDVKMELYTRRNPKTPFAFDPNNISQINGSNFSMNSDSKFLIGGYMGGSIYVKQMIPALLAHSDYNVFNVNWLIGSVTIPSLAMANAGSVGAMLGYFIELLKNETGYSLSRIHLIGHSLGSHICGYAGKILSGKVGRITGLDPAGLSYKNADPSDRLDLSDALFVDIIHTNAGDLIELELGLDEKIGDIDFYPNGGSQQTGCSLFDRKFKSHYDSFAEALMDLADCSHMRAIYLYTASIYNANNTNCQFKSYGCPDYAAFQKGLCTTCGSKGEKCADMGFNADRYAAAGYPLPAPNKFYLNTSGESPYCQN